MTTAAMLKTAPDTLHSLERGLTGYACPNDNTCYLQISDGGSVRVFVAGTDVVPKFECFSLALEDDKMPMASVTAFATRRGATVASVLLREEYIEPCTGLPPGLIGGPPATTQKAAKPNHVPKDALCKCLVAYGLMIEGLHARLVIMADWLPFKLDVTTDETRIVELLGNSETVPVARYTQQYGFS